MKKLKELELEIEDLELELLDAKKDLHNSRPQYQEDFLKEQGRYPVGDIPRAELERRVQLLENKLKRKQKEYDDLKNTQPRAGAVKFGYGELKEEVERLAKRDGFKVGTSVPGKIRKRWLKEIKATGKTTTDSAIRSILSGLTITKERPPKKET